jgi:predicted dehydrogenase
VVAIVSRNLVSAKNLAERYRISHVSKEIDYVAKETNADCLIICVSELSTEEVVNLAIEYPWTVLIEKPIGVNLVQGLRILERCGKKDNLFVALNRRYYGATLEILNEVEKLEGKRYVVLTDQEDQIAARKAGQPSLVVQNWMYANSIHIIDYVSIFVRGTLTKLTRNKVELGEEAYVLSADLEFDSGDYVRYLAYWNTPAKWSFEINVGDKQWQAKPLEKSRRLTMGERDYVDFPLPEGDLISKPGLISLLTDLGEHLTGKKSKLVSIKEGIKTMKLIEQIYAD